MTGTTDAQCVTKLARITLGLHYPSIGIASRVAKKVSGGKIRVSIAILLMKQLSFRAVCAIFQ